MITVAENPKFVQALPLITYGNATGRRGRTRRSPNEGPERSFGHDRTGGSPEGSSTRAFAIPNSNSFAFQNRCAALYVVNMACVNYNFGDSFSVILEFEKFPAAHLHSPAICSWALITGRGSQEKETCDIW